MSPSSFICRQNSFQVPSLSLLPPLVYFLCLCNRPQIMPLKSPMSGCQTQMPGNLRVYLYKLLILLDAFLRIKETRNVRLIIELELSPDCAAVLQIDGCQAVIGQIVTQLLLLLPDSSTKDLVSNVLLSPTRPNFAFRTSIFLTSSNGSNFNRFGSRHRRSIYLVIIGWNVVFILSVLPPFLSVQNTKRCFRVVRSVEHRRCSHQPSVFCFLPRSLPTTAIGWSCLLPFSTCAPRR